MLKTQTFLRCILRVILSNISFCKLKENPKGKNIYDNYIIRKYAKQHKQEKRLSFSWNSVYFVNPAEFHAGKKEMGKLT